MITGTLTYLGWKRSWKIGTTDVRDLILDWFAARSESNDTMRWDGGPERFEVVCDIMSDRVITYTRNDPNDDPEAYSNILLRKQVGFGMSNLTAYLQHVVHALNSREVRLDLDDSRLSIELLAPDAVHVVRRRPQSNSGMIDAEEFRNICRPGSPQTCIFVTSGSDGFSCEKFSGSMAEHLLNQRDRFNAKRIGNCKLEEYRAAVA